MRIGGFTRIFDRPSFEEVLDAAAGHGLQALQLNLESLGLPPMPDRLDPDLCRRVRDEAAARGLTLDAVSGTFNIIHPDLEERARNFRSLRGLAAACEHMGAPRITFSTGTRNADYMWGSHPDNGSPAAWADMLEAMSEAVEIAAGHGVPLVFEPEVSNVVDSAKKARRLLDHFESPFLKVVIDGANLFGAGDLPRMGEVLDEAFDLLAPDIELAHAKDLERDGEAGHVAAGTGLLDYERYLRRLREAGFDGALILHSLDEEQVPASLSFLRRTLERIG